MKDELTQRQQSIFDFLKSEVRVKGYPPAIREICDAVGLHSTSTVHAHLNTLEAKGYIRRSPTKNRSIEILQRDYVPQQGEFVNVPIVGKITAGAPILAVESVEDTFPIPVDYVGNYDVFMLRVSGDSMVGAGIFNRDLILVREQSDANDGDIVVAMLDDSITVKTFYREKHFIRLQPENDAFEPILTRDVRVLGKVIGLYRML